MAISCYTTYFLLIFIRYLIDVFLFLLTRLAFYTLNICLSPQAHHKTKHDPTSSSTIHPKKRLTEHTGQRPHDHTLKRSYDVTTSLPAPGGKIPRLENGAKTHARDHTGPPGTHPSPAGHEPRSRPSHAERDRDRFGGQSKERNRDG